MTFIATHVSATTKTEGGGDGMKTVFILRLETAAGPTIDNDDDGEASFRLLLGHLGRDA